MSEETLNLVARTVGIVATVAFGLLLIWYLYRYFSESAGFAPLASERKPMEPLTPRTKAWKVILWALAAFIVSRALMYLGSFVGATMNDSLDFYLADTLGHWTRWDANHYIGLIENWYVNEGDPRLHIVFFPLYPGIARLIYLSTGLSAYACAYLVANMAFLGCGYVMYRLTEVTYGENVALKSLWFLNLSPLTLFCSIPYTESVFILTTLMAVYFARRRWFIAAVIMGALSANSRMVGMATAIPIFYEMLAASKDNGFRKYALCVIKVLPVALGLIAYLGLNWQITGDPFKFMEYQSQHWSQNFGSLYNTLEYTLTNATRFYVESYLIGVWRPQLIAIICALILFALMARRAHPGDMGYSLIYYYCSVAPTWLLSGPRYLTAMYASYPFMALLFRDRGGFIAVCVLLGVRCMVAGTMYAIQGCIL